MKDFVSFVIDWQSIYFMEDGLLQENINVFHFPLFQLAYIHNKTNPSHTKLVKLRCEVHYMWRGIQDL